MSVMPTANPRGTASLRFIVFTTGESSPASSAATRTGMTSRETFDSAHTSTPTAATMIKKRQAHAAAMRTA